MRAGNADGRLLHVRAEKLCIAADRCCPADCVFDDGLNGGIVEGREGFVARLEIEDTAVSAQEAAAASEYLAALIPADEYEVIRLGNGEWLGIGFFPI